MKKLKKTIVSFIVISALLMSFSIHNAFAKDNNGLDLNISISPGIQKAELDPGARYKNNMTIHNDTEKMLRVHMAVEPYSVEDITYAPIYSVENAYTQISRWITFEEDEYLLEPYNSIIVNYTVDVPKDAPSGGQYAVLFAETEELNKQDALQAIASAGMLFMARVSGTTRETGDIENIKLPRFLLNPPVTASATFKNTGNVDADAKMTLKIENYFTGETIYDGVNEPIEKTIFPNTSRDFVIAWDNVPRLGVLKVTTTISFMDDVRIIPRTVIICPIWFIAIIILIIIFIVVRVIMRKRENNRTRSNSQSDNKGSEHFNI